MKSLGYIGLAFALVAAAASPSQPASPAKALSSAETQPRIRAQDVHAAKPASKPKIQSTAFGLITIDGKAYQHDVLIRLNGKVEKRKKGLSNKIYSTSHIISLEEAKHLYEQGAEKLIIGSGQGGMIKLSDTAAEFFKQKRCAVELAPTPDAIQAWNKAEGKVIAMFHITC